MLHDAMEVVGGRLMRGKKVTMGNGRADVGPGWMLADAKRIT